MHLVDHRRRRRDDFKVRSAAEVDRIACCERPAWDTLFRKQLHIAAIHRRVRGLSVVIDLPHGIFSQQDVHTADMVGMRMRENDFINSSAFFDPRLCELRTKPVTLVNIRRVNEDILRSSLHEDRIPLPDLEHPNDERSLHRACLSRS